MTRDEIGSPGALTSVVIVTFNSASDIAECLDSMAGTGFPIIVVDNASTDQTVAEVTERAGAGVDVRLLRNDENLGFAKAVNLGLQAAPTGNVLLLNPDAVIDGSDIHALLRAAASDHAIGILAPIVDNGPHVFVLAAGEQPRLWPMFTHYSGLARLFVRSRAFRGRHLYRNSPLKEIEDVGWVSGGCLLITERARAALTPLSERWFMYGEDIDLARRATLAGFRVVLVASAHASHRVGASVNASTGAVKSMWVNNTLDYYVSTYAPRPLTLLAWRTVFSFGLLARGLAASARAVLWSSDAHELNARGRRFRSQAAQVWRATGPL